jgi:hypothetical protein
MTLSMGAVGSDYVVDLQPGLMKKKTEKPVLYLTEVEMEGVLIRMPLTIC